MSECSVGILLWLVSLSQNALDRVGYLWVASSKSALVPIIRNYDYDINSTSHLVANSRETSQLLMEMEEGKVYNVSVTDGLINQFHINESVCIGDPISNFF